MSGSARDDVRRLLLGDAHGRRGHAALGHVDLPGGDADLRRLDLLHPLDGIHRAPHELVGLELHAIGGLRLDPIQRGL